MPEARNTSDTVHVVALAPNGGCFVGSSLDNVPAWTFLIGDRHKPSCLDLLGKMQCEFSEDEVCQQRS